MGMENLENLQTQAEKTAEETGAVEPVETVEEEKQAFIPVMGVNKKSKLVGLLVFLLLVFAASDYTALSFAIDDDMLYALFAIVPVFILAVVLFFLKHGMSSINVTEKFVYGKSVFGKSFSLPIGEQLIVTESKFSGVKLTVGTSSVVVSFVDNREVVCKALKDAGASVLVTLLPDENAVLSSAPDESKIKLHVIFTMISAFMADLFMTISAIWYNSPGNTRVWTSTTYDYEYIYGYWYKIPDYNYHYGKYYYFEEMFTSYISMAFSLICLVLLIVLIARLSNKLTIGTDFVTGTKFFGKSERMNIDNINDIKSNELGSSVSFKFNGKKKTYCYIKNHAFVSAKMQNAKLEKFKARQEAAKAEKENVAESDPVATAEE